MKHLRKGVSVASVLCLLLSLAAVWMAPGALAAPRSRSAVKTTVENGTQYKLSGYRDALDDLTRTVGDTGAAIPASLNSQWQGQVKKKGAADWTAVNKAKYDPSQYVYAWIDGYEWGGVYPGVSMYAPADKGKDLTVLCPMKTDNGVFDDCAAWAFTAPTAGIYEFAHSPDEDSAAYAETQFFMVRGGSHKVGVRITIDGAAIWPKADDASLTLNDGWAEVTNAKPVAIPALSDLEMSAGQVLRVECRALTAEPVTGGQPWLFNTAVSANMTYVKPIPPDDVAPEFPADAAVSNNADAATDTTLTLSWPQATDNKTAQNNLTYKVFYAASAIESLDGLTGVAAPGKTSLTLSGLEGSTDYYVAVAAYDAAGNYVLLAGGPFRTQDPPPKNLAEYEVYDYFDAIQAKLDALPSAQPQNEDIAALESASPWRVQLQKDGVWSYVTKATRADDYLYIKTPDIDWGGNFPGASFYAPKKEKNIDRYYLSQLMPVNPVDAVNPDFKVNAAMVFTAPKAGIYTFRRGSDDKSQSYEMTQYFRSCDGGGGDQEMGVRITVGGATIWPKAEDAEEGGFTIKEGWAVIPGYDATDTSKWVPVPTLSGLEMKAGEVLRVESKVFTQGEMPWFQKITACVAMDLNAELGPDTQAPVFSSGVLEKASASGTSLTLKWPAAADDQTAANGIKYTVFVGKEAITADSLPTEGGVTVTGETTAILGDLTAATDYYAAVVAEDAAGNKSVLSGGPFATLGETEEPDPDDPDDPVIADPTAPLTPNMDANSAGIISSATGRVQIGWNAAPGISHYRAYLFAKTDAGYTLDQKSDSLPYSAAEYTFENLESKNYEIQVVGYNMQGDAVSVYPVIALNMSGIGGGEDSSDGGVHPGPGGSTPVTGERVAVTVFLLAAASGAVVLARFRKPKHTAS